MADSSSRSRKDGTIVGKGADDLSGALDLVIGLCFGKG